MASPCQALPVEIEPLPLPPPSVFCSFCFGGFRKFRGFAGTFFRGPDRAPTPPPLSPAASPHPPPRLPPNRPNRRKSCQLRSTAAFGDSGIDSKASTCDVAAAEAAAEACADGSPTRRADEAGGPEPKNGRRRGRAKNKNSKRRRGGRFFVCVFFGGAAPQKWKKYEQKPKEKETMKAGCQ